jgi:catalase (peroxidase I)
MASVFYDVLNHIVIDSSLYPNKTSERACAAQHLTQAKENDLILYDRGYVAFWLYALHIKHNHHFCMRAKTNQSLLVKDFIKSKKKEANVTFHPNKSSIETCKEKGLSTKPITLRLVRVDLPNEVEVLITNLTDKSKYNANIFKSLYHMRWSVEENYKRLKQWVEIENFSGKSALSVQQDFYAKIVSMNLTALMVMCSQKIVSKKTKHDKLKYRVNFAQALSKMKHHLIYLIRHAQENFSNYIKRTVVYISQTIEAVREGRSAPRKVKHTNNNLHFTAYKSSL